MNEKMLISIAIPCYCSEKNIEFVVDGIREEFKKHDDYDYQIILANDGSPDHTFDKIRELCKEDKKIVGIDLSRNYSQANARMSMLCYADGDILALNAATLAGKLLQLANGACYDEYHNVRLIHDRKLDALEDLIEAANGKPVLVMYGYQHDLTRIQERFGVYAPDHPNGVRKLVTERDMADWNAGRIPIAVTQPASTGHGLNLQAGGSTIVWFGLTWSLELYEQANARLWRQGQKNTVVIHHLVVKGTMDEQVMRALRDKAAGQDALLAAVKARIQEVV